MTEKEAQEASDRMIAGTGHKCPICGFVHYDSSVVYLPWNKTYLESLRLKK